MCVFVSLFSPYVHHYYRLYLISHAWQMANDKLQWSNGIGKQTCVCVHRLRMLG